MYPYFFLMFTDPYSEVLQTRKKSMQYKLFSLFLTAKKFSKTFYKLLCDFRKDSVIFSIILGIYKFNI